MAFDDSGKQARLLPCLAILRYTVATVVTVLAVVVIVMVIAVGVRPDDVSVSVDQGHVAILSRLWYASTSVDAEPTATATTISRRGKQPCIGVGGRGSAQSDRVHVPGSCPGSGFDGRSFSTGSVVYGPPQTRTVYTPVKALWLQLFLSVYNPSGRGTIYCESINVTFYAGTAAEGMRIGTLQMPSSLNFNVMPQTSHVLGRQVGFNDTTMLKQIADTYGGMSSFMGTVEVTMNTYFVVFRHHSKPSIVTLVCSQVEFSVYDATATATSVQCAKSN